MILACRFQVSFKYLIIPIKSRSLEPRSVVIFLFSFSIPELTTIYCIQYVKNLYSSICSFGLYCFFIYSLITRKNKQEMNDYSRKTRRNPGLLQGGQLVQESDLCLYERPCPCILRQKPGLDFGGESAVTESLTETKVGLACN